MQIYADENFAIAVVVELRHLGHDVLTALEDGRANQKIPDDKVLERATELGRTILTVNRKDFKKLHETDNRHAGILYAPLTQILSGKHTESMTLAKIRRK